MQSFYQVEGKQLFSPQTYLENWENHLLNPGKPSAAALDAAAIKKRVQQLGSHTKTLWTRLNKERERLSKDYLDSPDTINAYLASFLLPNIERVFRILSAGENITVLRKMTSTKGTKLQVADFGSGPLSASVALLCALEYLDPAAEELEVEIFAVERSPRILEAGKKLLLSALKDSSKVTIKHCASADALPERIDIALCANVFNEIPVKHRFSTALKLFRKVPAQGMLLLLEPGQETHVKALCDLRDEILASKTETGLTCGILSPCTHEMPCPLSGKSNRRDWCWFNLRWRTPKLLKDIDAQTGLDHAVLNYFYILFGDSSFRQRSYARVISDAMALKTPPETRNKLVTYAIKNLTHGNKKDAEHLLLKNQDTQKCLLCTADGNIAGGYSETKASTPYRGALINKEHLKIIVTEKK